MNEILRYHIVVPKDQEAMIALDYNTASSDQLVEVYFSEKQFKRLWDSGVLYAINKIADVNIDFAEDESIKNMESLQELISNDLLRRDYMDHELNQMVTQIKTLVLQAIKCHTGVFFYF
jgi:hypothetical protein